MISTTRNCDHFQDGICSVILKNSSTCQLKESDPIKEMSIGVFAKRGLAFDCQCPATTVWNSDYLTCLGE